MCGIIAVLSRPETRSIPTANALLSAVDGVLKQLSAPTTTLPSDEQLRAWATAMGNVDGALRGDAGIWLMAGNREFISALTMRLDQLDSWLLAADALLERSTGVAAAALERSGNLVTALRDASWSLRKDRIRTALAVEGLAGAGASRSALSAYLSIQQAFSALDRLEVRGRDSAGVHVMVWNHGLHRDDARVASLLGARHDDSLFTSGAVRVTRNAWSFVYKAAAEIGELGDNTRVMRESVLGDDLLRLAVSQPGARVAVLGHTRWASVGIISEPNAHPVNSEELEAPAESAYLVAALNGDVDNHADLRARHNLRLAQPITTDAKVIPALVSRRVGQGDSLSEAFRETVAAFEGSVAIAAASADQPDMLLLALKGSGQGLCVGLAENRFVVASEPYGLVEETQRYVRLDGESLAHPDRPSSRGQVMVLDGARAGDEAGVSLVAYDGTPLVLGKHNVLTAEVTTRDIDRGEHHHFLAKEINEAPRSFAKTLRGRISDDMGILSVSLDESQLPAQVVNELANGTLTRVRVIGQGTAAIAGRSLANLLRQLTEERLRVDALPATELSGFGLQLDMRDTLIVAISQSGTTTDTNRTVDLARSRGARVVAIVNRRGSELTAKADGVIYTSDGRDVEMSVASTKAFYAQVAAGALVACAIAQVLGTGTADDRSNLLHALRTLPDAMRDVLQLRERVADAARTFATSRRYWTIVGNGANAVAAEEVRIKLSELCYKSIACDITEDKKHIDLSCEPLIFVCAAGLGGGTAADVAKEIEIFRAHKALPIVVATRGEQRFSAAAAVIEVPEVDSRVAFVLSVMVGHLFGYEAALAIDSLARPLRQTREVVEHAVERGGQGSTLLDKVHAEIGVPANRFFDALATGVYDGNLEVSTAVRLVGVLRTAMSTNPLQAYQRDSGKIATPESLLDDITAALTRAIDELTRPVDAIKHQAKTITVGISRSEEGLLDRPLVKSVLGAGAARERLPYGVLKVLADLDPAVSQVVGFTRYRIEGDPSSPDSTIAIVDRGGIARDLRSRVDTTNALRGTKRRVAMSQEVLVARGRRDNRTVIFVPETKGQETTGITLLHVLFHDRLPAGVMKQVLAGYDNRYDRLVDAVTETESMFREDRLGEVSVADALILPITATADMWRTVDNAE
ncbi:MAG: putative glucosamine-6-phosphate synthase [Actinomycetota bacterium]|jgi:glucosamine--fructose-6-phosphate aminotransferase (isomerizing)